MISDDEYLERIVAGIQSSTTSGADVNWNELINGRQFDVVVRFTHGKLKYLTVVEVKNRTRKTSASEMDAFVTKSRDHKANKSVFVTAAGFQEGAITVAKRHGIDLFIISLDGTNPRIPSDLSGIIIRKSGAPSFIRPFVEIGDPELTANVDVVRLIFADGKQCILPDERSEMTYYILKTKLSDGRNLSDLLNSAPIYNVMPDKTQIFGISISPQQEIFPPDEYYFKNNMLDRIECTINGRNARPIRGNTVFDPNTFSYEVIYTNVSTGDQNRFQIDQLPIGSKRVSVGKFYFIPSPILYYFCQNIHGDSVLWHLVESFQNGEKVSGTFTQNISQSFRYITVSDKNIIKRLKWRLDEYLALPR